MAFQGWQKRKLTLPDGRVVDASCPVILSASRATDIPAFFSTWFHNRLKAGYMRWTNPFNANQVQYISFAETRVIVFWTKNPKPLIQFLPEIDAKGINYYFQFTLNDYEKDGLEPNVAPLLERVETFKELSRRLGKQRVIWRFDPLILTDNLTIDVLIERIERLAYLLRGFTEKLVISFADICVYKKVRNNLNRGRVNYQEFTLDLMREFAQKIDKRSIEWGLKIATCAEDVDLSQFHISHNRCVDDDLMIELFKRDQALMNFLGYEPDLFANSTRSHMKDKSQRKECGCIVSKDIGVYDTCHHLCTYCYANTSCKAVETSLMKHNPKSENLIL